MNDIFKSLEMLAVKNGIDSGEVIEKLSKVDASELDQIIKSIISKNGLLLLAGGLAHDINNKLSAILGYSELGINNKIELTEAKRYFFEIQKAGERIKKLSKNLMLISKCDDINYEFQPCKLCSLISELTRDKLIAKKITIKENFAKANFPTVYIDQDVVSDIIENIINNAIKYAASHLSPEEKLLQIQVISMGKNVSVAFIDNGIGIKDKDLKNIFIPHERGKNGKHCKGNGIGLATCKKHIKKMHGEISAYSEGCGFGSTFTIMLPLYY